MKFQIVCDGACDLPSEYIRDNGIEIVPCYISFDGINYRKNYVDLSTEEFYSVITSGDIYPKTTLPSIQDYLDVFEKYTMMNIPILCMCMSSNLSGSYQSAVNAKNILLETCDNANVYVVDSSVDTVLQGLIAREVVHMSNNNTDLATIVHTINTMKEKARICFSIDSMKYLTKGGRINNLFHIINVKIGIKPVLTIKKGEHHLIAITRSRKKSIQMILKYIKTYFDESGENPQNYEWVIGSGINMTEAEELKKKVEDLLSIQITLGIHIIGAAIASHTGPYPIGVAFVKKCLGGTNA